MRANSAENAVLNAAFEQARHASRALRGACLDLSRRTCRAPNRAGLREGNATPDASADLGA